MTDPILIESKLTSVTNAVMSSREATNNRWHYQLFFDENIGWDWAEKQVSKVQQELGTQLEPYKLGPSNSYMFIEVRELNRREGIDNDQHDLSEFER